MNRITEEIKNYGFDDYKTIEINSREHQIYLLRKKTESRRTVETHYYEITVYKKHTAGARKLQGEYTFVYKPGTNLKAYLEQAKLACTMIKNRHYALVETTNITDVEVLDPKLSDPLKTGEELSAIIQESSKGAHVRLSSAELFLRRSVVTLQTSTGIEVSKEKGLIEVEVSLLGRKGKEEQELNFHLQRRSVAHLRLEERLREYCEHTCNMLKVQVPRNGKATVVFLAQDIPNLLTPIVFHSSGQAKDKGISRFTLGEKISQNGGNTFTLKSSGLLPYGLYTEPFDDDGMPGQEHTIIEQGIFKKYWATKRYADYLGVEPTGSFKNVVLEPVINNDCDYDDYYEIVQFSDFSPDPVTGDFVAEIRFGYHIKNGKKIPIKGGSAGGNVFQSLSDLNFSKDNVFEGNYLGPRIFALRNLSISGQ
jgi:predicted Zn-dependent protease